MGEVACAALRNSSLGACAVFVAPYDAAADVDASIRLPRLAS